MVVSLLRFFEHRALSQINLSGKVLDLGGEKDSSYISRIGGDFEVTTLNLDKNSNPHILHDLEKPLPIQDSTYDNVLLINVMEHISDFSQLLGESCRVVIKGGRAVIIVPFLFPIHPTPSDCWRFTNETLKLFVLKSGFSSVEIKALGTGVFSVCYLLVDRLLPGPIRLINFYTFRYLTFLFDATFSKLAKLLGKSYRTEDYPLGYIVIAKK